MSLLPLPDVFILGFSPGSQYWMSDGQDIHYVRHLACAPRDRLTKKRTLIFFFFFPFFSRTPCSLAGER